MKIYSDDGKEFKNVAECNAYEADLKLKEQLKSIKKEESAKALKELKEEVTVLNTMIKEYKFGTGDGVFIYLSNGEIKVESMNETGMGLKLSKLLLEPNMLFRMK